MRSVASALLIVALSSPLFAAESSEQGQDAPKKEKRVCRESKPTGSRLTVRTCHTQSEWAEIDKANREQADREVGRVQAIGRSDGTGFNPN